MWLLPWCVVTDFRNDAIFEKNVLLQVYYIHTVLNTKVNLWLSKNGSVRNCMHFFLASYYTTLTKLTTKINWSNLISKHDYRIREYILVGYKLPYKITHKCVWQSNEWVSNRSHNRGYNIIVSHRHRMLCKNSSRWNHCIRRRMSSPYSQSVHLS